MDAAWIQKRESLCVARTKGASTLGMHGHAQSSVDLATEWLVALAEPLELHDKMCELSRLVDRRPHRLPSCQNLSLDVTRIIDSSRIII